ncbi:MAG TPA: magnesium transporter, partial [Candidatus Binatia bacterium]|nr:magnesium transporter [Candidatus Binatia bacterium]
MKVSPIDNDTVREMLRTGTPDRLLRAIGKRHPADIALLFKGLEPNEVRQLFDLLFSTRRAAKALKELPPELLPDILEMIDDEKVSRLIARADPDDAVTFIDSLPEERREHIMSLLDPERREEVREIISYPDGTVGRLMTTDFLALPPTTTAQGAIDKIRERGELETFFYLYVVDADARLVGVVPIRNLVIAPPGRTLAEIMILDPIRAEVSMDQEEAARLVSRYDLLALPIVEHDGRLVGIITVDDVIDIITEESTEDMYKMAGLAEEDRVFTPVSRSVKMRLPWTLLNLLTTALAASVVTMFEGTINEIVALVTFMPIVAGVGGNGATQTATVIVRAIALGELEFSSARKAIVKQVSVNVFLALAAGALIAVAAFLWKGNPFLGLVLACAMIVNLGLVAGLSGAVIPILLKAWKFDPAMGSGIVVT